LDCTPGYRWGAGIVRIHAVFFSSAALGAKADLAGPRDLCMGIAVARIIVAVHLLLLRAYIWDFLPPC
jgi:hypothetical protein